MSKPKIYYKVVRPTIVTDHMRSVIITGDETGYYIVGQWCSTSFLHRGRKYGPLVFRDHRSANNFARWQRMSQVWSCQVRSPREPPRILATDAEKGGLYKSTSGHYVVAMQGWPIGTVMCSSVKLLGQVG